jgi:hypothetical protein
VAAANLAEQQASVLRLLYGFYSGLRRAILAEPKEVIATRDTLMTIATRHENLLVETREREQRMAGSGRKVSTPSKSRRPPRPDRSPSTNRKESLAREKNLSRVGRSGYKGKGRGNAPTD